MVESYLWVRFMFKYELCVSVNYVWGSTDKHTDTENQYHDSAWPRGDQDWLPGCLQVHITFYSNRQL